MLLFSPVTYEYNSRSIFWGNSFAKRLVFLVLFHYIGCNYFVLSSGLFTVSAEGHRLDEYSFKEIIAFSAVHCMQICLNEGDRCKSLNFGRSSSKGKGKCQLINQTVTSICSLEPNNTFNYFERVEIGRKSFCLSSVTQKTKAGKHALAFSARNIMDYVITKGSTPVMTAFTACLWIKTIETTKTATFVSYATPNRANEIVITNQKDLKIQVMMENTHDYKSRSHGIKINDGKWHHICTTWKSEGGKYTFYKDGNEVGHGSLTNSIGKTIQEGGIWVLGWDQDTFGGGFESDQAFIGQMVEVNIWNKVLCHKEILQMSKSCLHGRIGNVKSWKEFQDGVQGNVQKVEATC